MCNVRGNGGGDKFRQNLSVAAPCLVPHNVQSLILGQTSPGDADRLPQVNHALALVVVVRTASHIPRVRDDGLPGGGRGGGATMLTGGGSNIRNANVGRGGRRNLSVKPSPTLLPAQHKSPNLSLKTCGIWNPQTGMGPGMCKLKIRKSVHMGGITFDRLQNHTNKQQNSLREKRVLKTQNPNGTESIFRIRKSDMFMLSDVVGFPKFCDKNSNTN